MAVSQNPIPTNAKKGHQMTTNAAENATAGVPVVRGLVWEDADDGMCTKWRAAALGGNYELVAFDGEDGFAVNFHWGRPLSFWFIQGDPDEWGPTGPKMFPDLDEAKAAAQADYDQRILSTINPDYASAIDTARADIERLQTMLTATEKHGSVYAAVERVLDERSAWVARPNHETTMRVALAATIAANDILGDPVGKVADAQCAVTNAEMARDDEHERADRAEIALTAAQERIAELEGALNKVRPMLVLRVSRVGYVPPEVEDALDALDTALATLSPAVKEPK